MHRQKLLVSEATLDTKFTTQTLRVPAAGAFSQKGSFQNPIKNADKEDCAKQQSKLKA